ncbi:MAG: MBL fold metallo-hydrolase [Candidatus Marinimicrobia bacterium]|nr:MBL fold metallo-hydrolase [Candidatus Neomarinimicrobiota bacterium]|tara:strand:- start:6517 stop:7362 length:846 start_codon:yes stop_codon:yes gene_type:complete
MRIGNFDVTTLITSRFGLDGGSMFGVIPKSIWDKNAAVDSDNRISLVTRSLLIRGDGRIILVDTGSGDKWDGKMKNILAIDPTETNITDTLAQHAVLPDEVTDVICTHLHFDHSGGNTRIEGDQTIPTFPNATYHLQRDNWEWASSPTEKDRGSYRSENWEAITENGMFNLLEAKEPIFDNIKLHLTHGHTPGQMHPILTEGEKTLFFAGDLFPTRLHFRLPCIMAFDNEPLKTLMEKKEVLRRASDEGWIIILAHDPDCEAVKVYAQGDRFQIEKVFNLD